MPARPYVAHLMSLRRAYGASPPGPQDAGLTAECRGPGSPELGDDDEAAAGPDRMPSAAHLATIRDPEVARTYLSMPDETIARGPACAQVDSEFVASM